jgi:GT2 family glycosyltransferase
MFPHWQAFCLGYEAVRKVGLADEAFFPAYFEDADLDRRAQRYGVPVVQMQIPMTHENSSTLKADPHYKNRNANTFVTNNRHYSNKVSNNDFTAGGWSVERRRQNGWERDR